MPKVSTGFGAAKGVERVDSWGRENPTAALRVQNRNSPCGWILGPAVRGHPRLVELPGRRVRPGPAEPQLSLPGGPGASCQVGNPFNRIAHCLAVGDPD